MNKISSNKILFLLKNTLLILVASACSFQSTFAMKHKMSAQHRSATIKKAKIVHSKFKKLNTKNHKKIVKKINKHVNKRHKKPTKKVVKKVIKKPVCSFQSTFAMKHKMSAQHRSATIKKAKIVHSKFKKLNTKNHKKIVKKINKHVNKRHKKPIKKVVKKVIKKPLKKMVRKPSKKPAKKITKRPVHKKQAPKKKVMKKAVPKKQPKAQSNTNSNRPLNNNTNNPSNTSNPSKTNNTNKKPHVSDTLKKLKIIREQLNKLDQMKLSEVKAFVEDALKELAYQKADFSGDKKTKAELLFLLQTSLKDSSKEDLKKMFKDKEKDFDATKKTHEPVTDILTINIKNNRTWDDEIKLAADIIELEILRNEILALTPEKMAPQEKNRLINKIDSSEFYKDIQAIKDYITSTEDHVKFAVIKDRVIQIKNRLQSKDKYDIEQAIAEQEDHLQMLGNKVPMQQNEEKLKEEIKKRLIKENLQNFVSLVFTNTPPSVDDAIKMARMFAQTYAVYLTAVRRENDLQTIDPSLLNNWIKDALIRRTVTNAADAVTFVRQKNTEWNNAQTAKNKSKKIHVTGSFEFDRINRMITTHHGLYNDLIKEITKVFKCNKITKDEALKLFTNLAAKSIDDEADKNIFRKLINQAEILKPAEKASIIAILKDDDWN